MTFSARTKRLFALIDADVVDFVAKGECGIVDGASVIATECEVEEDVVGLMEGIGVASKASVDGLREIDGVEQFVVEIETDGLFVPIHAPDVKLFCPLYITLGEVGIRNALAVPHSIPALVTAPCGIGKDMGNTIDTIELHHIDLTTGRPIHGCAKCPNGWPGAACYGYLGTHFETSVEEGMLTSAGDA